MSSTGNHTRSLGRPRFNLVLLLLVLTGILLCHGWDTPAWAANPAEQEPAVSKGQPQPDHAMDNLQTGPSIAIYAAKAVGALAVVLGLLMLLAAALKKLGLSGQPIGGGGVIKVLDTKMIAPKKYVAVLDIAGQTMAVGVSEQQITLLTKLDPDEKLRTLADNHPSSSRFSSLLSRAVNNTDKTASKDHS